MTEQTSNLTFDQLHPDIRIVMENMERVIIGKPLVIRLVLTALLAGGHVLIEDVPGVGKTMLVRTAAKTLGCQYKRIQFTPDLLPSDVTGVSIYNPQTQSFEFRSGPIFGQVVLADEINRTSPKTQSALLQALDESVVTVDGETYELPQPFFVLATENPIEFEGTFPLPEAQLDRFLLKISMGYPTKEQELTMLEGQHHHHPLDTLDAVVGPETILHWRNQARTTRIDTRVAQYMVDIVAKTRVHDDVYLGASPRASLALYRATQAFAFISGRDYAIPDDVKFLVPYVLGHRLILTPDARLSGKDVDAVLADIVRVVPIPTLQGANL